ncbi:hypothetical protein HEQ62_06490 [Haematospirillum jordaniae]|uniref:Uncharacterized protein n=1 Tax=Haematospirillum jordaniae TaxID=1549855 RepID=A0A143DBY0_9PROT|nr:hypothetical protein [Haematospirillum jordaniae]AMW34156.1 hypothetical protein AY555_02035 [Haematospirillum jordaniae]NKD45873.1 hypothetical protein [Haematospirillum jordaniae]NKD57190.1 hypothetical protein [Haematospirillum jordaniae]NKD59423.1 hypothetical protein [Haematospirillum jordaniae]NKD67116.1 hypothetical protein [Haematospirillum jordaniae]
MSLHTQDTTVADGLSATASSLRAALNYVSARDELTCPDSVINNARNDEPVFVLRARDMVSTTTIEWWIWCARNRGVPTEKLERAERQRRAADLWIEKRLPVQSDPDGRACVRAARSEREDQTSVLNSAHPDEPVFVIVASDAVAAEVVEFWAFMAERHGAPSRKIEGAMEVAKAMARWAEKRVVGFTPRRISSSASVQEIPRPRHRTSMQLVCMECGHRETVGTPPYDEEMLTTVREMCEGACPSCGAEPKQDSVGRTTRVLTTEMAETP